MTLRGRPVTVAALMEDDPPTALLTTPVDRLLPVFRDRADPIPVVDDAHLVQGLVRPGDVAPSDDGMLAVPDHGEAPLVEADVPRVAADVMVPAIFRVTVDAGVAQAAALMCREAVGYLVVHDRGRLAGLLTSRHILRWLAQRGGYVVAD